MSKRKSGIPGFSWRRALGISSAKSKIARATGIPTTKQGRKRKLQSHLWTAVAAGTCAAATSQAQKPPDPPSADHIEQQDVPTYKPFYKRPVFWLVAFILVATLYRDISSFIAERRRAAAVYKPGDKIMTLNPDNASSPASASSSAPVSPDDLYYTEEEQAEAAAKYYESIGGNPYGGDDTAYSNDMPSSDTSTSGSVITESAESYILNTDTKVFHRSGCSSADKISDSNRLVSFGPRSDILSNGYTACGRCNP